MLPELPEETVKLLSKLPKIGVAVSGGGDSVALLLAVHAAFSDSTTRIYAASVNHGLRKEAASECEFVATLCAARNIHHTTLSWQGAGAIGNLQAAARDARYRLLADWAQSQDIQHVLLGHTLDDQAETILMALGRGAGPEGLSGMTLRTVKHGVAFLRPFLGTSRASLREGLRTAGQNWIDDPSNEDPRFQRIRVRQLLRPLEEAGIPLTAFSQVAGNMAQTAEMLDIATHELLTEHVIEDQGDYLLRQDVLAKIGREGARRLVLAIMRTLNSGEATPRRTEQIEALRRLQRGEDATIAGCKLSYGWGMVRFAREYRAVQHRVAKTDEIWDGRWQFGGLHADDLHISALGDAVDDCPNWRQTRLPRASLRSSPAIWRDDTLVSAPLAGFSNAWSLQIVADLPSSGSGH